MLATLVAGAMLGTTTPALADDAHYPRYEQDVWRARQDLAAVGIVIGAIGAVGGTAAFLVEDPTLTDVLGVQGTLMLAGGGAIASIAGLRARDYPLERKVTLVPAATSLTLAGLSGVGMLAFAANRDDDLHDPLLYGSIGIGGGATLFALVQLAANSSAWNRRPAAKTSMAPWVSGDTRGVALRTTF